MSFYSLILLNKLYLCRHPNIQSCIAALRGKTFSYLWINTLKEVGHELWHTFLSVNIKDVPFGIIFNWVIIHLIEYVWLYVFNAFGLS